MTDLAQASELLATAHRGRRLKTILYLDMVGYSRLVALDDVGTITRLMGLRETLIEPAVEEYGGKIVQTAGDSFLVVFDSIDGAVSCASQIQREMPLYDGDIAAERRIRFRAGVNISDVIDDGAQLHGDGLNVAVRLQSECPPGAVCVSRAVRDHLRVRDGVAWETLGLLDLKNIEHPVEAYLLRLDAPRGLPWRARMAAKRSIRRVFRVWRQIGRPGQMALAAAVVVLAAGAILAPRESPRAAAERLVRQGRAISCPKSPCPQQWLSRRALYERAIAADPTYGDAYALAAMTYVNFVASQISADEKEDIRVAGQLATRAVTFAPESALAHQARASVLHQDPDRLEDAVAAYLRSFSLDPSNQIARANAGWNLVLLGRPEEGRPYLEASLASDPNNVLRPAWLDYLGIAEFFARRYALAADYFKRSLDAQASDALTSHLRIGRRLRLAAALVQAGKLEDAKLEVSKVHRLLPVISTKDLFWNCDCSHAAAFLRGYQTMRDAAMRAGLPNAS